jgi:hypothetical protein
MFSAKPNPAVAPIPTVQIPLASRRRFAGAEQHEPVDMLILPIYPVQLDLLLIQELRMRYGPTCPFQGLIEGMVDFWMRAVMNPEDKGMVGAGTDLAASEADRHMEVTGGLTNAALVVDLVVVVTSRRGVTNAIVLLAETSGAVIETAVDEKGIGKEITVAGNDAIAMVEMMVGALAGLVKRWV